MFLSVFDLFKIGVGPSSSHTMGPMTAAGRFLDALAERGAAAPPAVALRVRLHGSLAFTGHGHGTDRAVVLGLSGFLPATVDPDAVEAVAAAVARDRVVTPAGHPPYRLDPAADIVFDRGEPLPGHPNGMAFEDLDAEGRPLLRRVYYSIGGGFVADPDELAAMRASRASVPAEAIAVPHAFSSAGGLLRRAAETGLSIAEMQRDNERVFLAAAELDTRLDALCAVMNDVVDRGLRADGVLPGRLGIRRRARALHECLLADGTLNRPNPLVANDWLSVYAMAVNEENAAGGRIVTAPTNGAAGVIPAVMRYVSRFYPDVDADASHRFLLTAAAIGGVIKHNASISGAEVGCQGEVGSAAAMAAAGLAAVLGGCPAQVENAAEIALEHHLGLTCDPIAGLVQVPCIERNAFGAVKAVTAASMALKADGAHFVPLDACVATMRQTGLDMSEKYKETSLGGLAVNLPDC
jgi:L-serine dehydratase